MMQRNKRHSRRRLKRTAFQQHVAYTDSLDTFDWIPRDSVYTFCLVLTLTGVTESGCGDSSSVASVETDSGQDTESHVAHDDTDAAATLMTSCAHSPARHHSKEPPQRTVTLGDVHLGCSVPEDECSVHWQTMLLQPRQSIVKWQNIY